MKRLLTWVMLAVLAAGVASCGNKGKVKSPAQIQAIEAKKARKAAKAAKDESPSPEPDEPPIPTPGVTGNSNTPKTAAPAVNAPTGTSAGRISVITPPSEKGGQ